MPQQGNSFPFVTHYKRFQSYRKKCLQSNLWLYFPHSSLFAQLESPPSPTRNYFESPHVLFFDQALRFPADNAPLQKLICNLVLVRLKILHSWFPKFHCIYLLKVAAAPAPIIPTRLLVFSSEPPTDVVV